MAVLFGRVGDEPVADIGRVAADGNVGVLADREVTLQAKVCFQLVLTQGPFVLAKLSAFIARDRLGRSVLLSSSLLLARRLSLLATRCILSLLLAFLSSGSMNIPSMIRKISDEPVPCPSCPHPHQHEEPGPESRSRKIDPISILLALVETRVGENKSANLCDRETVCAIGDLSRGTEGIGDILYLC